MDLEKSLLQEERLDLSQGLMLISSDSSQNETGFQHATFGHQQCSQESTRKDDNIANSVEERLTGSMKEMADGQQGCFKAPLYFHAPYFSCCDTILLQLCNRHTLRK